MNTDDTRYFECACHSDEHRLVFHMEMDDIWNQPHQLGKSVKDWWQPEVYVSTFLNHWEPWWKRIWMGFKYVLGFKSKYGHFDTFMMRAEDAVRVKELCEQFIARTDEYWQAREKQSVMTGLIAEYCLYCDSSPCLKEMMMCVEKEGAKPNDVATGSE